MLSCNTIHPFFFGNYLSEWNGAVTVKLDLFFHVYVIYYTIIDFNETYEVGIRTYQPKKSYIHQGRKSLNSITCFVV